MRQCLSASYSELRHDHDNPHNHHDHPHHVPHHHDHPQQIQKSQPVRAEEKINRNAPCPCGSGKKYKKCHGKQ